MRYEPHGPCKAAEDEAAELRRSAGEEATKVREATEAMVARLEDAEGAAPQIRRAAQVDAQRIRQEAAALLVTARSQVDLMRLAGELGHPDLGLTEQYLRTHRALSRGL